MGGKRKEEIQLSKAWLLFWQGEFYFLNQTLYENVDILVQKALRKSEVKFLVLAIKQVVVKGGVLNILDGEKKEIKISFLINGI